MKSKLLGLVLIFTASIITNAQTAWPDVVPRDNSTPIENGASDKNGSAPSPEIKTTPTPNQTQAPVYVRPTGKERFHRYLEEVIGPTAFIGPAFGASFNTATNSPEEWGKSMNGFGRRFASEVGKNAIKETVTYGLDEAFKLDSHYYRSTKKGFIPRLNHALISSVTARNQNGKVVFGFPRIVGGYSSEIIAYETWYPKRFSYKDGLREGTITIGTNALVNVFKEFVFK